MSLVALVGDIRRPRLFKGITFFPGVVGEFPLLLHQGFGHPPLFSVAAGLDGDDKKLSGGGFFFWISNCFLYYF